MNTLNSFFDVMDIDPFEGYSEYIDKAQSNTMGYYALRLQKVYSVPMKINVL